MSMIPGDITMHTQGLITATKICTAIYDVSAPCFYYPALTGGTLYKTGHRKDLDIVLYEHLADGVPVGDKVKLLKALILIGFIPKDPLLLGSFSKRDPVCSRFVYKFNVFHVEGVIKTEGYQDSEGRVARIIDIDLLFPNSVSSGGFYDEASVIQQSTKEMQS